MTIDCTGAQHSGNHAYMHGNSIVAELCRLAISVLDF